jgi:hypothetical protein
VPKELYCSRFCTSKIGREAVLVFTGFRAQSAPPETPVSEKLENERKFLKKKKK